MFVVRGHLLENFKKVDMVKVRAKKKTVPWRNQEPLNPHIIGN